MLNSTGKTASLCLCVLVCQRRVYDNGARWWIQREFHGRSTTYQQLTASPGNRVARQYVAMQQRPLSLSLVGWLYVRPLNYKLSPDILVLSQLQQFTRVTSCQCSGCS